MLFDVTNAAIEAILRNEGRHAGRPGKPSVRPGLPPPVTRESLKPDWCQFPPGSEEEPPRHKALQAGPWTKVRP